MPGAEKCDDCGTTPAEIRADACTVIIVGKKASVDGSVMTTHTCDCGLCDWTWRYVPPADHKPGTKRKIYHFNQFTTKPPEKGLRWDTFETGDTGLEIPQAPHTYGYLHGMFGYMNDNQVAIGESTIGCRKKMENTTPAPKFDITMLTLIAMERAKTAREAVKIMGDLSTEYGYGFTDSGEMLALSDPNEVWIFEVLPIGPLWTPESGKPGAVWCAQRVPDNHVSVCPNESRIGEINLKKKDYFMASENAISYAVKKGYYDPKSKKPFNWKKAYNPSKYSAANSAGSRVRMWRFFDLVAPSKKFSPETLNQDLPFSIKPEKKLSVYDVIKMTRDKCEGTKYNPARGFQGGPFGNPNRFPYGFKYEGKKYNTPRIIAVNRAEYVTVTQTRDWLPNPIGGLIWLAFGSQDTSCYMPLYQGITKIPESFKFGDHWTFDRKSARWAFDYVDYHTQVYYSLAIEEVRKLQQKWEESALKSIPALDKHALGLYKKDPAAARAYLTEHCTGHANLVIDAWWELGDRLLVQYNKLWYYNIEERKREAIKYPDWWLKELIRYNGLKPQPEEKKKD
ncbi:MAG: C69 family dipeptidase [Candidatus Aminicenantes bacterium]|nr:C69 family dipeptidase [Candidatus Aminicenantes bacterium]